MWYIIISVLAVLIILALLGFCFLLGRRREKSNLELIKVILASDWSIHAILCSDWLNPPHQDANEREKVKENEYVKEQFGDTHEIRTSRGPNPVSVNENFKCFHDFLQQGSYSYCEERQAAAQKPPESYGGLY